LTYNKPYKQGLSFMSNPQKTENPTGAGKKPARRATFDSRLKLKFHGSKLTSDAGLLADRELVAALGLTDLGENLLNDWRPRRSWTTSQMGSPAHTAHES
jgi:hypothetical protein